MKIVGASYKTEFVTEFRKACERLKIKQSTVFKEAMEAFICFLVYAKNYSFII